MDTEEYTEEDTHNEECARKTNIHYTHPQKNKKNYTKTMECKGKTTPGRKIFYKKPIRIWKARKKNMLRKIGRQHYLTHMHPQRRYELSKVKIRFDEEPMY